MYVTKKEIAWEVNDTRQKASGQSYATHVIIIPLNNSTKCDFLRWIKVLALFLFPIR